MNIPWTLSSLGQLAILLEVSAPKPGNVNRLKRFSDTGYRHFLASAALTSRGYYLAAKRGVALGENLTTVMNVRIGDLILETTRDVFSSLNRKNAIFGTILLHVPLIVGIAATLQTEGNFNVSTVEEFMRNIIINTNVEDTISFYQAIHLATPQGDAENKSDSWNAIHDRFDVFNPRLFDNIREDNITLYRLFELSSPVDAISREWASFFHTILREVFPYLEKQTKSLEDIEEAIVRTFIWRLAQEPDGLVIKKAGREKAEQVCLTAKRVIEKFDNESEVSMLIDSLDTELRAEGNILNPGSTADLVSATVLCKLVSDSWSYKEG